jgi:Raf kinase inhibitor-like YbhB/YbcL family protein
MKRQRTHKIRADVGWKFKLGLLIVIGAFILPLHRNAGGNASKLTIASPAFSENGMIPRRYCCNGSDISPALSWEGVPEGTRSLALICDDPDAPAGTWVHWVLFNIPPGEKGLPPDIGPQAALSNGAVQGTNDFGRLGYGGPCPPRGTHRYYFKLYALDTILSLDAGAAKTQVEAAMKGHILAQAQLMGKYRR